MSHVAWGLWQDSPPANTTVRPLGKQAQSWEGHNQICRCGYSMKGSELLRPTPVQVSTDSDIRLVPSSPAGGDVAHIFFFQS